MVWIRFLAGLLALAAGFVWMAQGLNASWAPGSFMTGSRNWIFIGIATMGLGLWLIVRASGRRGRGTDDGG